MRNRKIDTLRVEAGTTESGKQPVGGEIAPIDKFSIFLSQYGLMLPFLLIPLAFILYKKRATVFKTVIRTQMAASRRFH